MLWIRNQHKVVQMKNSFKTYFAFHADSTLTSMANIPQTCQTFCKKCGKHQPLKVTQHKKSKDSVYTGKAELWKEAE